MSDEPQHADDSVQGRLDRFPNQKIFAYPFLQLADFPCGRRGPMCTGGAIAAQTVLTIIFLVHLVVLLVVIVPHDDHASQVVAVLLFLFVVGALILSNSVEPGVVPSARIGAPVAQPQVVTVRSDEHGGHNGDDDSENHAQLISGGGATVELAVCSTCRIVRPARSSHTAAGWCVRDSDHLCNVTGADVSTRNMRFFILAIFSFFCFCAFVFVRCLVLLLAETNSDYKSMAPTVAILFCAIGGTCTITLASHVGGYTCLAARGLTQKDIHGRKHFVDVDDRRMTCERLYEAFCSPLEPTELSQLTDEEWLDARGLSGSAVV